MILSVIIKASKKHDGFSASEDLDHTLKLLKRHDVIAFSESDSSYRIASELMRQWINRQTD